MKDLISDILMVISGAVMVTLIVVISILSVVWAIYFPFGAIQGTLNECKPMPMLNVGYNLGCYLSGNVYK